MQKILLDTDIGTDIDDAVCLAYLLANPECELLGITTVTGEAEKRAMLASALCRHAGKDIPIFPGAEHPMVVPLKQRVAQQVSRLGRWNHATTFPRGEAVEFLRSTIRENPGEITLLTIGPLTNIGLLFSVDPEIPRLLRGLVMMCGRFRNPIPDGYGPLEWNAIGDPHATTIVYRSPVARHRSVGIDVTHTVYQSAADFREQYRTVDLMAPVVEFAEEWFKEWPGTTYHDPLAAATLFTDQVCDFERGKVSVDLTPSDEGLTRWAADTTGPHEIAVSVAPDRFFDHVDALLGRGVR